MPNRILVVDDDISLLQNLTRWLQVNGYDAVGTGSVTEAMQMVSARTFELAIVDIQLPDGAGIDLLSKLRQHDPRLVCLILSGQVTLENVVASLRHGLAFDFLRKPVTDMNILHAALKTALNHRGTLLPKPLPGSGSPGGMSGRELEVLDHLSRGLPNKDIAKMVGITEKTVRNHLTAIYGKLGVSNRTQALVRYQQWRTQST